MDNLIIDLVEAFTNEDPVVFDYKAYKSTSGETEQRPVLKILDIQPTKDGRVVVSGVNLRRVKLDSTPRDSIRSYRVERISNLKVL